MGNKKWKIYIVAHKKVYDEMYINDPQFNYTNYCILNVGQLEKIQANSQFSCVKQSELVKFVPLGKWWAESEGIYNIWRDGKYRELDFIGFLHYDKELRTIKRNFWNKERTDITAQINDYIEGKDKAHISFETYKTRTIYRQRILADVNQPNTFNGSGVNCLDYILKDYNEYHNTDYTRKDLFKHRYMNLCSCFLIDVGTFGKMMEFFEWLLYNKKLEPFDTFHKNRMQGGLAERYFGVFLLFEYEKMFDLSLIHHYDKGWK